MFCCFYRSCSSSGPCSRLHYSYSQVAAILSLLLSTSSLLLLSVLLLDAPAPLPEDLATLRAVSHLTTALLLLQLLLSLVTLSHLLCPSSSPTFLLSVGVREGQSGLLTTYGATSQQPGPVAREDITVFYQRVHPPSSLPKLLEPLLLPLPGAVLPGQALALLLSLLLLPLQLSLAAKSPLHTAPAVVYTVVALQQLLVSLLSLLTATDTGILCPGLSVTRWFLHTDVYSQRVESAVARQFSASARQPLVTEWFSSSLPEQPGQELMDRAGQLRLLQHLLETTHSSLAQATPGLQGAEEGGLFLSQREVWQLREHYLRESLEQGQERVLYTVGGS